MIGWVAGRRTQVSGGRGSRPRPRRAPAAGPIAAWLLVAGLALAGCGEPPSRVVALAERSPEPVLRSDPIHPLASLPAPLDSDEVALGERLFHDQRLSGGGGTACASCHDLARGGADGRTLPLGAGDREGKVNTPTVFNSRFNFRQFWDGRARNLLEQIDEAVHGETELDSAWPEVVARLRGDPSYVVAFREVYGDDGISESTVESALATFVRSLVTPDAPFDRYLAGDPEALTPEEVEGYRLFRTYGCVSCHQGQGVGGNMYQKFGLMGDYYADRGESTEADLGRFNVTGREEDRHVFKVPSLRNVAVTAPYFHDGRVPTLLMAVHLMARYQLGRSLPPADARKIVAFLHTLTGEYRGRPLSDEPPTDRGAEKTVAGSRGAP